MALFIETIYAGGIAQLSYLIGDDSEGLAAVIDPRPDCDIYLQMAKKKSVAIKGIFETHIHADFLSGARELSRRLGGAAIHASVVDAEAYGFDIEPVRDADRFEFGEMTLFARHTPGHTPEHMSYLVHEEGENEPFAVFSGDTLFVDSVGRPDLLGEDATEQLAEKLYHSIRDVYLKLGDGVIIYPGHGAGSACGPDIGDRMVTTIGYERKVNPYLQIDDKEAFIEKVLESAPPEPRHYRPMKKVNAAGPTTFNGMPPVRPLTPKDFAQQGRSEHARIIDTRSMLAFGASHIPQALNIAAQPELSVWSGWLVEFDEPLYLVLETDENLEQVVNFLWRTGHTNVQGYLAGGMSAWIMDGRSTDQVEQIDVHQLSRRLEDFQVLDVRTPEEQAEGFIPTSQHIFLPEVREKAPKQLDRDAKVATYCATGFRASIAASILKQLGFTKVYNVPGSFTAWQTAGKEVATERESVTASPR